MNNRAINSWEVFCGGHTLETDSTPISIEIGAQLDRGVNLSRLPWDRIAKQYGHAFKEGRITPERFYSILELRAISQVASQFSIVPFERMNDELQAYQHVIDHFYKANHLEGEPLERFQALLNSDMDPNEKFMTRVEMKARHWNPRIYNLLLHCHEQGIIYLSEYERLNSNRYQLFSAKETLCICVPSMTARTYAGKVFFKETGFTSFIGRVGPISIDDIENGVRQYARCGSFSYPGVIDPGSFHEIEAPMLFLTLHDELHRHAMAAIPDDLLDAYLHVIDLVRNATGMHWSRDLWNFIDLEISIRRLTIDSPPHRIPERHKTEVFQYMLTAERFSDQGLRGLFVSSDLYGKNEPMLDTALIIIIDFIENEAAWQKRGIYNKHFTDYPEKLLRRVRGYLAQLEASLPIAVKVAVLKHCIVNKVKGDVAPIVAQYQENTSFQKRDRYIQVVAGNDVVCGVPKSRHILKNEIFSLGYGAMNESAKKRESLINHPLLDQTGSLMRTIYNLVDLDEGLTLQDLEKMFAIVNVLYQLIQDAGNEKPRKCLYRLINDGAMFKNELTQVQATLATLRYSSDMPTKNIFGVFAHPVDEAKKPDTGNEYSLRSGY